MKNRRQKRFLSKTNGKLFLTSREFTDKGDFYQKRTEFRFANPNSLATSGLGFESIVKIVRSEVDFHYCALAQPSPDVRQNGLTLATSGLGFELIVKIACFDADFHY